MVWSQSRIGQRRQWLPGITSKNSILLMGLLVVLFLTVSKILISSSRAAHYSSQSVAQRLTSCSRLGMESPYSFERAMRWYEMYGVNHTMPSPSVMSCLKAIDAEDDACGNRVAVVVSHSNDIKPSEQREAVMGRWKAYCKWHGYEFVHNLVAPSRMSFFTARWLSLLDKRIWENYDWVLHIDDDAMIMNMSKSLQHLMPHGGPHLIFAMRENSEVAAGVVLIRTSTFSACVLRHWVQYGAVPRSNWDNGDLVQVMLDFVDPDLALFCDSQRPSLNAEGLMSGHEWKLYETDFIDCSARAHPKLPFVHLALPLRFYFPMTGLWHTMKHITPSEHITSVNQAVWEGLYNHCWSTDFLRHSNKDIGGLWTSRITVGEPRKCARLTPKAELLIAQKCCLWHYPGCVNDTGHNLCRHQAHCLAMDTGMPVPQCREYAAGMPWSKKKPDMARYLERRDPQLEAHNSSSGGGVSFGTAGTVNGTATQH